MGVTVLQYKEIPPPPDEMLHAVAIAGVPAELDAAAVRRALAPHLPSVVVGGGDGGLAFEEEPGRRAVAARPRQRRVRHALRNGGGARGGGGRGGARAAGVAPLSALPRRAVPPPRLVHLQAALATEAIDQLSYRPALRARLEALPPKLVRIGEATGRGCRGRRARRRPPRARRRASDAILHDIQAATFTNGSDAGLVLGMYGRYITRIQHVIVSTGVLLGVMLGSVYEGPKDDPASRTAPDASATPMAVGTGR